MVNDDLYNAANEGGDERDKKTLVKVISMAEADALLVEEKSRLSVLVIEGNGECGFNALAGLSGYCDVKLVATLEQAIDTLSRQSFDLVLSGAHVPLKEGEKAGDIVRQVMAECLWAGTPVCFITEEGADIDFRAEGYISITATPGGEKLATEVEIARPGIDEQSLNLFRILRISKDGEKGAHKSPDIWNLAFEMTRAAALERAVVSGVTPRIAGSNPDVRPLAKVVPDRR